MAHAMTEVARLELVTVLARLSHMTTLEAFEAHLSHSRTFHIDGESIVLKRCWQIEIRLGRWHLALDNNPLELIELELSSDFQQPDEWRKPRSHSLIGDNWRRIQKGEGFHEASGLIRQQCAMSNHQPE
jgi:hypothetical protein